MHKIQQPKWKTFSELIAERAEKQTDVMAIRFLVDGEENEDNVTYGELHRRAGNIAALIRASVAPGDRVLLLYPPGQAMIAAFFGCFYAGVIAVPAYPPEPSRIRRTLPRLQAIIDDAQAKVVLTTGLLHSMAQALFAQAPKLSQLSWVVTDQGVATDEVYRDTDTDRDTVAMIQYTSGSTSRPRGVMLTHENLLVNSAVTHTAFGHSQSSHALSWLPPYHDMGLIGTIMQPLYLGFPGTLMSPLDFLRKPRRWLQAISRYRATTSGAPNFAYGLCVRRIPPERREGLDLSTWTVAFNGAEPIDSRTLNAFVDAFEPYGFRRESLYPCYGLAESTLIVSGGEKRELPNVMTVSSAGIEQHEVREARADEKVTELVSCGQWAEGHEVRIVDGASGVECPAGRVGEIWLSGACISRGYWNAESENEKVFGAMLTTGEGPYMRTGDLGFVNGGELYVTGRIKDMLVVRGRNYYPQDIEKSAGDSHADLRPSCGAAFMARVGDDNGLVIVFEVYSRREVDCPKVVWAIRRAVANDVELQVAAVVLLKEKTVSKTSSGKIQRRLCRQQYLDGTLEVIHSWSLA